LPFFLVLLAVVGLLLLAALRIEGDMVVNGAPVAIDDETRMGFAVGLGLRVINLFLMLFVLFRGVRLLLGDAEAGCAAFDLTASITRGRYLAGRAAGLTALLAALWLASLLLLAAFLGWRFGVVHASLLPGAGILFLGAVLLTAVAAALRLTLGRGWGAMAGFLIWAGSWFLSLDMVESYLWEVDAAAEGGGWWMPMLAPFFESRPIGLGAEAARILVRFFPPIANMQSVGLDIAAGKPVFPPGDGLSIPIGAGWILLLGGIAYLRFQRRDW